MSDIGGSGATQGRIRLWKATMSTPTRSARASCTDTTISAHLLIILLNPKVLPHVRPIDAPLSREISCKCCIVICRASSATSGVFGSTLTRPSHGCFLCQERCTLCLLKHRWITVSVCSEFLFQVVQFSFEACHYSERSRAFNLPWMVSKYILFSPVHQPCQSLRISLLLSLLLTGKAAFGISSGHRSLPPVLLSSRKQIS